MRKAARLALIGISGIGILLCGVALGVGLAIVAVTVMAQDWLDGL